VRLALAALLLVAAPGAAVAQNQDARLDRVEHWLKAVMRHEAGTVDDAAWLVGSWDSNAIRMLWIDANVIVQLTRNPKGVAFSVRFEGQARAQPVRYSPSQLHRLKSLACAAAGRVAEPVCLDAKAPTELDADLLRLSSLAAASRARGDDNYVLRRGALLHSDIAMLIPQTREPIGSAPPVGPLRYRMQISDGREVDLAQVGTHWETARMLLDYVIPAGADRPAPSRDDMVRAWYRTTAMWMQSREDHDTVHLQRARSLFPSDADILFLSGCQRETYASASIQSALKTAVAPTGVRFDVALDAVELRQAESFFRRALAANPRMPEGHLRFGHVLLLLGRPADAAVALRRALASTDEVLLRYYGLLFLGATEEALGNFDAARDAFAQAATLYPTAQSPGLALSALARRRGDRNGALRELQRVFELPSVEPERDDPWWTYYVAQGRHVDDLLEQLRRPFLGAEVER
jgi:tetratricopeptide (TPR) repeat protein